MYHHIASIGAIHWYNKMLSHLELYARKQHTDTMLYISQLMSLIRTFCAIVPTFEQHARRWEQYTCRTIILFFITNDTKFTTIKETLASSRQQFSILGSRYAVGHVQRNIYKSNGAIKNDTTAAFIVERASCRRRLGHTCKDQLPNNVKIQLL